MNEKTDLGTIGRGTLPLPAKATCTAAEAAAALGVSVRQIKYWIDDGKLLAINASREFNKSNTPPANRRNHWRVVVRRPADAGRGKGNAFLTLEELIGEITNINA